MDNTKAIPEPELILAKEWTENQEQVTAMDCVQFGYNLALVKMQELETENIRLRAQIK